MTQQRRITRLRFARGIAPIGSVLALAAGANVAIAAPHAPVGPRARTTRALSINDTGKLSLSNASGAILSELGPVSGTLPGTTKVRLDVGENVTASFTIYARGGGSITGHGVAALHSSGQYSSFGGTLTVTHGTGRYVHARGGGKLYGVINRRTDAVTVQTTGTLDY
jgi:hypothetical protein